MCPEELQRQLPVGELCAQAGFRMRMARWQELEVLRLRQMALLSTLHLQVVSLLFNLHRLRLLNRLTDLSSLIGEWRKSEVC